MKGNYNLYLGKAGHLAVMSEFLTIIRQDYLLDLYENEQIGSRYKDHLNLHFSFELAGVMCSKLDLTSFLADYSDFPVVE